jgi:[protein-PII] uridylyltransferase
MESPPPPLLAEISNPDPLFRRLHKHVEQVLFPVLNEGPDALRPVLKQFLANEEKMVQRYHEKGDSGLRVCLARSIVFDVMMHFLFWRAESRWKAQGHPKGFPFKVTLLASGGYGRAELSPFSDIDILILLERKPKGPEDTQFLEFLTGDILYPLWDLKLKIGHATRTLAECITEARAEPQSFNALLEARPICGDPRLAKRFLRSLDRFFTNWKNSLYIQTHNLIQQQRREKYGPSLFLQEPDIKNGVGGLRDFQYIVWMARVKYRLKDGSGLVSGRFLEETEFKEFRQAYDFLLRVRNQLHFMSSRPTDLLDLEKQPTVAAGLGYRQEDIFQRVEAFMKDYYHNARIIQRTSQFLAESFSFFELPDSKPVSFREVIRSRRYNPRREIDGFVLREGVFQASHRDIFKEDPERLIRFFRHLQQFGGRPDYQLRRLIERSQHLITREITERESACRSFRSILQTPGQVYPSLSLMHELGILGRFIPEFAPLTCLVQHEYYHRYTADVHILSCIKELDKIFQSSDPPFTRYRDVLRKTEIPTLLYLILLLHDIGKAKGIKNHALTGVPIAADILRRLSIPDRLHERILYIVRNHLEMARFWQRFDVDDPSAIQAFAQTVEDPEKLRLLYVHTYCDTKATAASLWNDYKDGLHSRLLRHTLEVFEQDPTLNEKREQEIAMLQEELIQETPPEITEDEVEAHFNLLPERYFIHHKKEEINLHIRMVHDLLTKIQEADSLGSLVPVVDWQDNLDQGLSVVTVVTWDRAGLFYKLAGAFSVAGLNILSTKAISRGDHITIDTFYVTEPSGGSVQDERSKATFFKNLEASLLHESDLLPEIMEQAKRDNSRRLSRGQARLQATFPPSVSVYHELSLKRTIIEIQANDQIGLLYRLSKAIFEHGFDIHFARIATENSVAMDTFYIESIQSEVEKSNENLLALRETLTRIISEKSLFAA